MRPRSAVLTSLVCMTVLSAVATSIAFATHPHERTGFMIGFGIGGGSADLDLGDGFLGREAGGAGHFRVGYAVRPELTLGLESSGFVRDETGAKFTFNAVTAAATFFPSNVGFYVRGGLGLGISSIELDFGGATLNKDETGFGLLVGSGYEWRLTPKFALGPQAEFVFVNIGGDVVDQLNYFDGSLQLTWYW